MNTIARSRYAITMLLLGVCSLAACHDSAPVQAKIDPPTTMRCGTEKVADADGAPLVLAAEVRDPRLRRDPALKARSMLPPREGQPDPMPDPAALEAEARFEESARALHAQYGDTPQYREARTQAKRAILR